MQGKMMHIVILTSEPVRLRTCWKYGTERAKVSIATRITDPMLLLIIIFVLDFMVDGRLRSNCMANGAN